MASRILMLSWGNNISIKVIQQAGKKAMPIADFLRGTRLEGEWLVK